MAFSITGVAAEKARRAPQKTETLACRLGTEDRHARIAVVLVGGKTDSFAYYSKWKPRTCSIYLQRNKDSYSRWADNGNITTVNLERGAFLIEHKKGEYHFIFHEIDRERYCGMEGQINGSLTIRKGKDQCELDGVMEEGIALGSAFINREEDKPPPGLMPDSVPASAPRPSPEGQPAQQSADPASKPDAAQQSTAPATTGQSR